MADQSDTIHFVDAALIRLLPAGATLQGVVTSQAPQQLLIEGRFEGRMELEGASRIVVAAGAEIHAELLRAHTVVVRGRVTGQVHAQVLELCAEARMAGSVRYDTSLAVEPGARIRASIDGPDL